MLYFHQIYQQNNVKQHKWWIKLTKKWDKFVKKFNKLREKELWKWKNSYKEEEYYLIKEDKDNFYDKNIKQNNKDSDKSKDKFKEKKIMILEVIIW